MVNSIQRQFASSLHVPLLPPPSWLLTPDHLAVQETVPCQRGEAGGAAEAGAQEFTVSRGQTWLSLETCRQPRETIWTALFLSSSHLIYGTELEWNIVWNGRKYLKQPPESHSSRGDAISLDADSLSLYFRYINSAQVNWHTTCHIRRGEVCPWCDVQFGDPPHCRISPTSDQDFDDDFSLWNYLFLLIMEKLSVTLPLIEGLWSYPTQCSAV